MEIKSSFSEGGLRYSKRGRQGGLGLCCQRPLKGRMRLLEKWGGGFVLKIMLLKSLLREGHSRKVDKKSEEGSLGEG